MADKGKYAESQVQKALDTLANSANVAYLRMPDARAAMGRFKAMPCDFLVACNGAKFLEVKELKHPSRIAKDKVAQVPRLRMYALAGIPWGVIVFHSVEKVWRYVPAEFFGEGELPASWDLSALPTYKSAAEALTATGWFLRTI